MIEELYFDSWTDEYFYEKYETNKPYVIYQINNYGIYKKVFTIAERIYDKIMTKEYEFEEWFAQLNKEDKQEAVWMMHD